MRVGWCVWSVSVVVVVVMIAHMFRYSAFFKEVETEQVSFMLCSTFVQYLHRV